ncbi:MAG: PEP-utilizing enzyme [Comamonadaceae bacterium]|nr:PEP-utilizing enzyme [Comamonadaceae bacterium]
MRATHLLDERGGALPRPRVARARERARDACTRSHPARRPRPRSPAFLDAHLLILEDKMLAEAPAEADPRAAGATPSGRSTTADATRWSSDVRADRATRTCASARPTSCQVVDRRAAASCWPPERRARTAGAPRRTRSSSPHDLSPADTVLLKHAPRRAAFVTDLGGPTSHTAILARSLDDPGGGRRRTTRARCVRDGELLIVDGTRGVLVIADPDRRDARRVPAGARRERRARAREAASACGTSRADTRDGTASSCWPTSSCPTISSARCEAGADGIGLFRTEFLFMNRDRPARRGRAVRGLRARWSQALTGKPVTIRTLDLGADKHADGGRWPARRASRQPGARAARGAPVPARAATVPDRSCARSCAPRRYGTVRILIPMLSRVDEIDQALGLIARGEGRAARARASSSTPDVPVGGMIEVPAAALAAGLFARAARLPVDRHQRPDPVHARHRPRRRRASRYLYDPLHPSVLRLIRHDYPRRRSMPASRWPCAARWPAIPATRGCCWA